MLNLALLLAQLVVVLVVARLAGGLVKPLRQPPVVGEMIAGLALGPSLLGAVSPGTLHALFPSNQLLPLATLSQLGVLLFMFVVGLRLDLGVLRGRAHAAVAVSHTSIIAPFLLGVALAKLLYADLAPPGVAFLPFALFLGAAMSITAFPVLARILAERKLLATNIGTISIAAAAIDDATAWCILAAVVAVAHAATGGASGWSAFAFTLGSTAVYVVAMIVVLRPLLAMLARRLGDRWSASTNAALPDGVSPQLVSIAVVGALASAWATEALGVHALFGAFVAGAIAPRTISGPIADRIEGVVSAVLLPVFFAFTGLRTSVGLISGPGLWAVFALILFLAVAGKMGGAATAARLTGMGWRDSLSVGALMNTRGLMELVILSVGLDIGVISPTLFAMMVLMALVTTVMTSPLLGALYRAPESMSSGAAPHGSLMAESGR